MAVDLRRFLDAQNRDFGQALAELRAGRKRSHWIWYVFPQLRGLGSSSLAEFYGLSGPAEAEAYLRDDVLRQHLIEAIDAVDDALTRRHRRLDDLMGSHIDALKLVSSLTLFEHVGRTLNSRSAERDLDRMLESLTRILTTAEAQGYPRCEFTVRQVAKSIR